MSQKYLFLKSLLEDYEDFSNSGTESKLVMTTSTFFDVVFFIEKFCARIHFHLNVVIVDAVVGVGVVVVVVVAARDTKL